ncbi:penicillin-binding protein activator [Alphaproteobacteria bacterium]|nr:penicillin-binding protein activator [Alphaproteobacteria bacterium]
MKYFYLSIKILFSIGLISCSSLDLVKEEDNLIIINQDKEKPLKQKPKEAKQKPITSIDSDKENTKPLITKKTILSKSKNSEKDKAKVVFDKIIKIGLLLPLSGEQKDLGKAIYNALEMALFETQSKNIKLMLRDSGGTEKKAISAAKELEREGVSILIGPIFSSQALAIRKEINKEVPIFSFTNDESIRQKGLWVLGFSPQQQIKAIFKEIKNNAIKNIAIIVPNSFYGEISLQESRRQSTQYDINIHNIYFYDVLSNNFSELGKILHKEKNKKYKGLLIIASGKQLKEIAARAQFRGINPKEIKYFGLSGWNDPEVLNEPALIGGHFIAPQQSSFEAFVSRYFKIYNSTPLEISGLGYDILALCAIALKQTESIPDFIDFLTNPSGYNGIFGFFRVDKNGEILRKFVSYKVMKRSFVKQHDIMP